MAHGSNWILFMFIIHAAVMLTESAEFVVEAPRNLGDTCEATVDCSLVDNADCIGKKCACKNGYKEDAAKCIMRNLGDTCEATVDCSLVDNADCIGKKCACKNGYKEGAAKCIMRNLGDTCEATVDCSLVDNADCIGKKCACKNGYKEGAAKCIMRLLGEVCSKPEECAAIVNGDCNGTMCVCQVDMVGSPDKEQCQNKTKIGDNCNDFVWTCGENAQCNVTCEGCDKNATCQCEDGYAQKNEEYNCSPRLLGETCSKDEDCAAITNGDCNGTMCGCQVDMVGSPDKDECQNKTKIGENCVDFNWTCGENAQCDVLCEGCEKNATCQCEDGYAQMTGEDYNCSPRKLGDTCAATVDCSLVDSANCTEEKCTCIDGYIGSEDKKTCNPGKLDDVCADTVDCILIGNANCTGGKCACNNGYKVVGEKCSKRLVGETCSKPEECEAIANGNCNGTMCVCKGEMIVSPEKDQCQSRTKIGEKCVAFDWTCGVYAQCNVTCEGCDKNATCECDYGYAQKKEEEYNCSPKLDSKCTEECYNKYAVCRTTTTNGTDKSCECPAAHKREGDKCSGSIANLAVSAILLAVVARFFN